MKHRKEKDMPSTSSGRFAAKLRAAMREHQVTQVMLAERLGLEPGNVSRFLSGNANLGLHTIDKILAAISGDLTYDVQIQKCSPSQSVDEEENSNIAQS